MNLFSDFRISSIEQITDFRKYLIEFTCNNELPLTEEELDSLISGLTELISNAFIHNYVPILNYEPYVHVYLLVDDDKFKIRLTSEGYKVIANLQDIYWNYIKRYRIKIGQLSRTKPSNDINCDYHRGLELFDRLLPKAIFVLACGFIEIILPLPTFQSRSNLSEFRFCYST